LEKFDEWKDSTIVEDLVRFLDNVLQSFIDNAPDTIQRAKYSARRERAVGIGTMGFHGYLQSKGIPFEGGGFNSSVQHTNIIFKHIVEKGVEGSKQLAMERGEPEDMKGTGLRNSRLFALAPNANNSDLLNTSPTIEPYFRNIFLKSTKAGNFTVKNMHLAKVLEKCGKDTEEVWKSIQDNEGRVTHLDFLSEHEKNVFKVAMEIDQHWVVELAEHRGAIMGERGQSQSLNLFFPFGSSRKYVNSVHLKFLKSPNVYTLYYFRGEKEGEVNNAKEIERKALVDWSEAETCASCEG
jgi:ribonucleoside-diphosphate reductase alpha chain